MTLYGPQGEDLQRHAPVTVKRHSRQQQQHLELEWTCRCGQKGLIFVRPKGVPDWDHGGTCWTYERVGEWARIEPSLMVPGHFHTTLPWHVRWRQFETGN